MKLLRYGVRGGEKPGLLDDQGVIRDLSGHLDDITSETVTHLTRLAGLDPALLPAVRGSPRLGVPVKGIGKFIAIGLNYADHAKEAQLPIPSEPPLFTKAISCLSGPDDDVMLPKGALKGDWEVELGVILGRTVRYVNEVGDPQNLSMFLNLNGRRMQTGHTRNMIFSVARLIAYVSEFMTLYPGDLLTTGTPAGVGMGQKPAPVCLKAGDRLHLGIEKLGEQNQNVVAWRHLGGIVLA